MIWLWLATVNWCGPLVVSLAMLAFFHARGEKVVRYGPQIVIVVDGWPAERFARANWGGFTWCVTCLLWRERGDELIGHERGHVWIWLLFGLVGGLVYLLILVALRPFHPSWRAAYLAHPIERWCDRYGERWARRRTVGTG